jgi:uncharacterized protein GlcG (DUF336 family)
MDRDMSRRPRRHFLSHPLFKAAMAVLSVLCAAPSDCGGGGGSGGGASGSYAVPDQTTASLTAAQVQSIINQAANEAVARTAPAVIAVVDRVGNVLAVEQMTGVASAPTAATCAAAPCAAITSGTGAVGGLEGVVVPSALGAISKAITGAYLSSGGNAFSTRTANEIVQQNFPPQDNGQPGGPLFGVQFSQLPCSDLGRTMAVTTGPHHAPLGLAADAGGLPIYINGVLVGGIGVMSTASYAINPSRQLSPSNDEGIALAGVGGFQAPVQIEAPNIAVNGVSLDYLGPTTLAAAVSDGTPAINPPVPVAVAGFFAGVVQSGQQYGSPGSGIVPDATLAAQSYGGFAGVDVYDLVDNSGANPTNRFAPTAGTAPGDGNAITAAEAGALVGDALEVADAARAGIRIPTNSHAEVSASVIDLDGNVLAIGRSPDAPVFSADVSLQKARSAVFFSRNDAQSAFHELTAITVNPTIGTLAIAPSTPADGYKYYANAESVGFPSLFDSGTAFSEVAIGNLARPFFPDGEEGEGNGPLSLPGGAWSVFSTGLQTDLVHYDLAKFLVSGTVSAAGCGNGSGGNVVGAAAGNNALPVNSKGITQLANGLQIFSGGYPIFRGGELIGALGVSGDGIQQDALIAYLGIQGSAAIGVPGVTTLANAPAAIRADTVAVTPTTGSAVNLLYVVCPPAPFIDSRDQTPCS